MPGEITLQITEVDEVVTLVIQEAAPGTTTWAGITGKPATFPPSEHTHDQYALASDLGTEAARAQAAEADLAAAIPTAIAAIWDSPQTINASWTINSVSVVGEINTDSLLVYGSAVFDGGVSFLAAIYCDSALTVQGQLTTYNSVQAPSVNCDTVVASVDITSFGTLVAYAGAALLGTGTKAPLRLYPQTAPTAPQNGDIWPTTTALFVRLNGATQQVQTVGSAGIFATLVVSANSASSSPAAMLTGSIATGGTGATNLPHFLIQPSAATASTDWSTSGTAIGVNAVTGYSGNLLDLKIAGATRFYVTASGIAVARGAVCLGNGNSRITETSNGVFALTNGAVSAGVNLDVSTDGLLKIRNRANSADAPLTAANITASGSLTFVPPAAATPATNGQLTFEATSNTTLAIKLRGTDGVVRSAVLTLA